MAVSRPFWFAAFAGLTAINLAALTLTRVPNVSDEYRAYFIDRSTDCWPVPVSGEIAPGKRVWFLKGDAEGPAKGLLHCGWTKPDGNGTWSLGPEARLVLKPGQQSPLMLELDLLPFTTPDHPQQRVSISANGEAVAQLLLDEKTPRRHEISIEQRHIANDGTVELSFAFPDAISQRELGLNNDRRRLAIRLISLRLHEQK